MTKIRQNEPRLTFHVPIRFERGKMKPFMVSVPLGLALSMCAALDKHLNTNLLSCFAHFTILPFSPYIWPSASFQSIQNNKSFHECRVVGCGSADFASSLCELCELQREIDMARWQFSIFRFWFFFCSLRFDRQPPRCGAA